MIEVVLRIRLF